MSFGLFEANVTSDEENKRQVREAANKLAAATYDVRERFGPFLFAARDLAEYNDRLALSKNDILKTIEPHVFPRTGTVRRVLKPLENEFKSRRTAMTRTADWGLDPNKVPSGPAMDAYEGKDTLSPYPGAVGSPPNRSVPMPPSGGTSTVLSPSMSMSEAVNLGDAGAQARGETPQNSAPATGGAGVNTVTPPTPSSDAAGSNVSATGTDASGSDWSPNGNTDAIGAGDYQIQSGDTLTSISERSGVSVDDLASGNNIDNPDMIYAGDSLNIPGLGGDGSSSDSSAAAPSPAADSAPLAAEAGGSGSGGVSGTGLAPVAPLPDLNGAQNTNPGLTAVSNRRAAARRRAEFERNLDTDETFKPSSKELKPEGDFKGWLDSVDQDAEDKVDRNFGGTFPGGTEHDGDPAKTDFVKDATRRFASWCRHNKVRITLASLDHYGPSDREYIAIAADLQRLAAPGVPGSKPKGPEWNSKGKPKAQTKPDLGTTDDRSTRNLPGGTPTSTLPGQGSMMNARRRTAAPDYLQKADEALTNLLNQKAEEFQQTIAPLQQALQTVQQAEQEAAAANPMNVMPPAGTVNVLPQSPGSDPSGGAGGGMDPSALAGLMGGGDPSMGGGAPPGGGMTDPTSQAQQMMARRGKARGASRPRTANDPWAKVMQHPFFNEDGWNEGHVNYSRQQGHTPEDFLKEMQENRTKREQYKKEWNGASLADIGKEHGIHPARLREYADMGNFTNLNAPLNARYEQLARGVAQKYRPKKPQVDYSDPSSAQVGLTMANRRTAESVDQLWDKYVHENTVRGGLPDVDSFASQYKIGPKARKRIEQKALGG